LSVKDFSQRITHKFIVVFSDHFFDVLPKTVLSPLLLNHLTHKLYNKKVIGLIIKPITFFITIFLH